jgi:hypothetical protein
MEIGMVENFAFGMFCVQRKHLALCRKNNSVVTGAEVLILHVVVNLC